MPFGAKNSAACYSQFIDMVITKLRTKQVLAYIDDLLVYNRDIKSHIVELENLFQAHRQAGIKIKASKTHLVQKQTYYLGYKVTARGIAMREDYVEKVVKWPQPKTVKQLQTFLGFINYYRTFFPEFSFLTNEFNSQRKSPKLVWTSVMEEKFMKRRKENRSLKNLLRFLLVRCGLMYRVFIEELSIMKIS